MKKFRVLMTAEASHAVDVYATDTNQAADRALEDTSIPAALPGADLGDWDVYSITEITED